MASTKRAAMATDDIVTDMATAAMVMAMATDMVMVTAMATATITAAKIPQATMENLMRMKKKSRRKACLASWARARRKSININTTITTINTRIQETKAISSSK